MLAQHRTSSSSVALRDSTTSSVFSTVAGETTSRASIYHADERRHYSSEEVLVSRRALLDRIEMVENFAQELEDRASVFGVEVGSDQGPKSVFSTAKKEDGPTTGTRTPGAAAADVGEELTRIRRSCRSTMDLLSAREKEIEQSALEAEMRKAELDIEIAEVRRMKEDLEKKAADLERREMIMLRSSAEHQEERDDLLVVEVDEMGGSTRKNQRGGQVAAQQRISREVDMVEDSDYESLLVVPQAQTKIPASLVAEASAALSKSSTASSRRREEANKALQVQQASYLKITTTPTLSKRTPSTSSKQTGSTKKAPNNPFRRRSSEDAPAAKAAEKPDRIKNVDKDRIKNDNDYEVDAVADGYNDEKSVNIDDVDEFGGAVLEHKHNEEDGVDQEDSASHLAGEDEQQGPPQYQQVITIEEDQEELQISPKPNTTTLGLGRGGGLTSNKMKQRHQQGEREGEGSSLQIHWGVRVLDEKLLSSNGAASSSASFSSSRDTSNSKGRYGGGGGGDQGVMGAGAKSGVGSTGVSLGLGGHGGGPRSNASGVPKGPTSTVVLQQPPPFNINIGQPLSFVPQARIPTPDKKTNPHTTSAGSRSNASTAVSGRNGTGASYLGLSPPTRITDSLREMISQSSAQQAAYYRQHPTSSVQSGERYLPEAKLEHVLKVPASLEPPKFIGHDWIDPQSQKPRSLSPFATSVAAERKKSMLGHIEAERQSMETRMKRIISTSSCSPPPPGGRDERGTGGTSRDRSRADTSNQKATEEKQQESADAPQKSDDKVLHGAPREQDGLSRTTPATQPSSKLLKAELPQWKPIHLVGPAGKVSGNNKGLLFPTNSQKKMPTLEQKLRPDGLSREIQRALNSPATTEMRHNQRFLHLPQQRVITGTTASASTSSCSKKGTTSTTNRTSSSTRRADARATTAINPTKGVNVSSRSVETPDQHQDPKHQVKNFMQAPAVASSTPPSSDTSSPVKRIQAQALPPPSSEQPQPQDLRTPSHRSTTSSNIVMHNSMHSRESTKAALAAVEEENDALEESRREEVALALEALQQKVARRSTRG
ncbi:unnamed protein product [Amoebophrya sp. A25]|nr:unnamed protein product [Amoebophrya sp. A25]|eukprot:GSA25T00006974001.1